RLSYHSERRDTQHAMARAPSFNLVGQLLVTHLLAVHFRLARFKANLAVLTPPSLGSVRLGLLPSFARRPVAFSFLLSACSPCLRIPLLCALSLSGSWHGHIAHPTSPFSRAHHANHQRLGQ